MNNLNFVSLIGRLAQDNELKTTTNGRSFLSNSIAVQRNFKNANGEHDTDFINVTFSGKTAEFVNEHFHKGDVISVLGNISVTTKETENGKRTFTNVNVDNVAFVPGVGKRTEQTAATPATTTASAAPAGDKGFTPLPVTGSMAGFDDDDGLPF